MVINAEDIDLRPLYFAVAAWLVGVIVVALVIAFVASRLGRRRLGCGSMILALVITVTGAIVLLVAFLLATGDATFWDGVWMLLLAPITALCLRILLAPAVRGDES